jgi:hypothetical protein
MRTDLNFNLGKNFNLFLYGDDHEGNAFRYDEGVAMVLDMLHSPWGDLPGSKNFMVHHGDPTESIFYNDMRYDQGSHYFKDTLFRQVRNVVNEFRRHRKKILFMLDGNHGNCHRVRPYGNPTLEICNQLQIPFGTYAAIVSYREREKVLFRHYAGHGWGSVSSRVKPYKRAKANMEIQLRAALEQKAANCALMSMGHVHRLVTYKPDCQLYMRANGGGLKAGWTTQRSYYGDVEWIPGDLRWYACTGSMVKLTDINRGAGTNDFTSNSIHKSGYAEMAGYDPVPVGFCIAEVRDGKIRDVKKIAVDDESGPFIID